MLYLIIHIKNNRNEKPKFEVPSPNQVTNLSEKIYKSFSPQNKHFCVEGLQSIV